jgi:hypothetical protein
MSAKVDIDGNGNIVIQKVEGSTITINPAVPEDVRKALIEHQALISQLPDKILQMLMEKNAKEPPLIGANVYLGLSFLAAEYGVAGISMSVQITNLTKEIRFYNKPFFKVSTPFEKGADTFMMTNVVGDAVSFPRKMEYGEVISENYKLVPGNIQMFQELLAKDPDVRLTAYVSTTLGEVYKSEPYIVKDIVKQGRYVR